MLDLAKDGRAVLIPVCPEQLGGLPTPRHPSERQRTKNGSLKSIRRAGAVLMNEGSDVTESYRQGALTALKIAKLNNIDYAVLKSGSPSCGKGLIYDGSFSGRKAPGNGVTAEMLEAAGFRVLTDEDL